MTHELKTWPEYFQAVYDGLKPFELRKDDRPYNVGDVLRLREYEPMTDTYTGRVIDVEVTYCLRGFAGIEAGYVVIGIRRMEYKPSTPWPTVRDAIIANRHKLSSRTFNAVFNNHPIGYRANEDVQAFLDTIRSRPRYNPLRNIGEIGMKELYQAFFGDTP